jgi:hypothetical protein
MKFNLLKCGTGFRSLIAGLILATIPLHAQFVVDNFDKNQAILTQSGSGSTGSTITGSMLGGERDIKVTVTSGSSLTVEATKGTLVYTQGAGVTGTADIVWDGTDGNFNTVTTAGISPTKNFTTGGQNAFMLGVLSNSAAASVTITVYSSAGTQTGTINIPAGITSPMYYQIAQSAFTGTGNFTAVGAVQLTINSSPGTTLVLDFLRTSNNSVILVDAPLTDIVLIDNDGNGVPSPGDTIQYVVRITNNDSTAKTGVTFNAPQPANTTLGTVTATPIARADGPLSTTSTPGQSFHGSFNTTLTLNAASGLLTNDFLGSPNATITSFGITSYAATTPSEAVTAHSAGGAFVFGGNSLTVNADGGLTLIPNSTFTGLIVFKYRLANAGGTSDGTATLAVGFRPGALADSYLATGNVQMSQTAANGVINKATADTGDNLAVLTFGPNLAGVGTYAAGAAGLTLNNGNLTLNADGSFTYNPAAGFVGSDTFVYKVDNGFSQPSPATVTITVSACVWFVNNAAGAGDGRLSSPFNTLNAFSSINDAGSLHPKTGEVVFFYTGSGNYTGVAAAGLTLLNNQKLIGQGASFADFATASGITFAAGSLSAPSVNGTDPVIANSVASGHGITLASGNTIRGITVGNTPNGFGYNGGTVGTFLIEDCSKTGTGGAIQISTSGTAGAATLNNFNTLDSSSAPAEAINLVNVGGSLVIGAGTITGPAGTAIKLNSGSGNLTYPGNITKNSAGRLLDISSKSGGTVALSGTLSHTHASGTGINVANNTGTTTVNLTGNSKVLNTSANTAVTMSGNSATTTLNFSNGGLDIDTTTGIGFTATGGGTVSVTGANNSINSVSATALNVVSTTIGGSGLTFNDISSGNNTAAADPLNGIVLNNTGSSGGLTVTGNGATSGGLLVQNGTGGTIQRTTGDAVSLNNAFNVTLKQMNITSPSLDGVEATGGGSIKLSAVFINTPGAGNPAAGGDGFGTGNGFRLENVTGVNGMDNNSRVSNWQASQANAVLLHYTTANFTSFTFSNSKLDTSATGAAGFHANLNNSSAGTVSLLNSEFTLIDQNGAQVINNGSGAVRAIVQGNNFHDADATSGDGNNTLFLANSGSGAMNFTIGGATLALGNTFHNLARLTVLAGVIQVDCAGGSGATPAGGLINGTIQNNNIWNDSGFSNGRRAIDIQVEADSHNLGTLAVAIKDNIVNNVAKQAIHISVVSVGNGSITEGNWTITGNSLGVAGANNGIRVGTEANTDSSSAIEFETNVDVLASSTADTVNKLQVSNNTAVNQANNATGDTVDITDVWGQTASGSTGQLHLTVTNNTLTNQDTGGTGHVLGILNSSGGTGEAINLNITGNNTTLGASTAGEIRLRQLNGTFNIQGGLASVSAANSSDNVVTSGSFGTVGSVLIPTAPAF